MLLVCVTLGEIPPFCKLNYVCPVDIAYTALCKAVLQDGRASYSIRMCTVLMT